MKKIFILPILLSSVFLSCNKDPEPEPEGIFAYCNLYHFIPEMGSVLWDVYDEEFPDESLYAQQIFTRIFLETTTEELVFAVKHPGTKEVLVSQLFQLEEGKYYNVIVYGSAEEPILFIKEIDTSHPAAGMVKFQILHSIPDQGPIDLYMGDTTLNKRVLTALDHLELSDPFEVSDFEARASITVTAHADEYLQDSVLLHSIYNDLVQSGANYLSVVAHHSYDTTSNLSFWLFNLPLD